MLVGTQLPLLEEECESVMVSQVLGRALGDCGAQAPGPPVLAAGTVHSMSSLGGVRFLTP